MVGRPSEAARLRSLLAVHRQLLSQALELAAAVCADSSQGTTAHDRLEEEAARVCRAAVERVREVGGSGGVGQVEMGAAERVAHVLARAVAAVKGRKSQRVAGAQGTTHKDHPQGAVSTVLCVPELLESIAAQIDQADVLAFALVDRSFLAAARGAKRKLVSPLGGTALASVARARWILQSVVDSVDASDVRVCAAAAGEGSLGALQMARSRGFAWDHSLHIAAAEGGHVEVMDWCDTHGLPLRAIKGRGKTLVCAAAASAGHQRILSWLSSSKGVLFSQALSSEVASAAARGGHLPVLRWLRAQGCPMDWRVYAAASSSGHMAMGIMEYAISERLGFEPGPAAGSNSLSEGTCAEAAGAGRLDVLRWARDRGCPLDWHVHRRAAAAGHLHVLKYALSVGVRFETESQFVAWCYEGAGGGMSTCRSAVVGGHCEVVRWLVERGCPWGDTPDMLHELAGWGDIRGLSELRRLGCPWGVPGICEYVCQEAASAGHLHVLKWLRAQDPPCPWSHDTCSAAAASGNLEMLQWLRAQDPPCPWSEGTSSASAACGNLEVLQWLRSRGCPWGEDTCSRAAARGRLGVVEWLRAQRPPCPWDQSTCFAAASGGHLPVLEWLRAQDPPCPWNAFSVVRQARRCGHEELAAWALAHGGGGATPRP